MTVNELVKGVQTTLVIDQTVYLKNSRIYLTYAGKSHPDTFSMVKTIDGGKGSNSYQLFFPAKMSLIEIDAISKGRGNGKHGISISDVTPERIILEYLGFTAGSP